VKAAHRAGRPLSRWYFALLIAAALISLYAAGTPLWWGDFIPFVLPIWGMLIGYWLARLIAALKLTGPAAIRRRAARWAVPPLVFLALLTAVVWDGPRLARFALKSRACAHTRRPSPRGRRARDAAGSASTAPAGPYPSRAGPSSGSATSTCR